MKQPPWIALLCITILMVIIGAVIYAFKEDIIRNAYTGAVYATPVYYDTDIEKDSVYYVDKIITITNVDVEHALCSTMVQRARHTISIISQGIDTTYGKPVSCGGYGRFELKIKPEYIHKLRLTNNP